MVQEDRATTEAQGPLMMEEHGFQTLYESLNRSIYNFFANRGFSREECRDLMQETFLAALRSRDRFRGQSSAKTWIFAIATNIWRTTVRDRQRFRRNAAVQSLDGMLPSDRSQVMDGKLKDVDPSSLPLERYLIDERIRLLRDALDDLPPQMRRCVILRLHQDMKYREIAEVMQVSINTVRSQLFEAREKLRKRLGDRFMELPLEDRRGAQ